MCPKTVSCKECTYVQKHINENDEKIDPPADYEQTFSSSYFMKEPNETVEMIYSRLKDINMERIQYKREKPLPKNNMTRKSQSMRKKWQHPQMALLLMIWRKVSVKQKMTRMKNVMRKKMKNTQMYPE